jgi:hypothetical protein
MFQLLVIAVCLSVFFRRLKKYHKSSYKPWMDEANRVVTGLGIIIISLWVLRIVLSILGIGGFSLF